ncbi:ectoine hydroxylase [Alicyclobacillus sp. SO9]|nr:ectoine hydroxylase [Alicyclobacillus sp. SO9]QQE81085.1 ectoine hydroxylase [Alicyclobacillus sp. SO9]
MTDLYPSRIGGQATITDRKDPVLHGEWDKLQQGRLTESQLKSYQQSGYLLLENLFSEPEVDKMLDELKVIWRDRADDKSPEVVREPSGKVIRSVFDIHRNNPLFEKVSQDPRVREAAEQVLGSDVYIHQSRINFKPGFVGKEFYWHSDFETWHVEDGMPRMRAVSFSILLDDNMPYNGSLMLIPGSQNYFVSCVGETPENHFQTSLRKQELGVPDNNSMRKLVEMSRIDMPVGKRGSVLMFECNTMHGSASNISPFPRRNVFMVFNSINNQLVEPFSGRNRRPEFIANRTPSIATPYV